MITDPRVFDDEHLPRELMHREGAVETLLRSWSATRVGNAGEEVIICGPSGVGKTALARHTLRRLTDQAAITHAYVGCLGATAAKILRTVCRAAGADVAPNDPADVLQERLTTTLDHPAIVILDEADDLPGSDALRLLAEVPMLSTVVITHDMHRWLARVERPHDRYLSGTHLELHRYGVDELADILAARAQAGLPSRTVTRRQLERIADDVAGVAREGIQALRAAAEIATKRGHGEIKPGDIDDSYAQARHRIRQLNLQSLPFHHHVLYALIHAADRLDAGTLHERYDTVSEAVYADYRATPIGKRSRRNKLQKLVAYDLILRDGPDHDPTYAVVDRDVNPELKMPPLMEE
jgi:Cdc6-like AAA superfamily ATPase